MCVWGRGETNLEFRRLAEDEFGSSVVGNAFEVYEDVENEFGRGVGKRLQVRLGFVLKLDTVFDLADEAFQMLGKAFDLFGVLV